MISHILNWNLLLFVKKIFTTFTMILTLFWFFFFRKILTSFSSLERFWMLLLHASFQSFLYIFDNIHLTFSYVEKKFIKNTFFYKLQKLILIHELCNELCYQYYTQASFFIYQYTYILIIILEDNNYYHFYKQNWS